MFAYVYILTYVQCTQINTHINACTCLHIICINIHISLDIYTYMCTNSTYIHNFVNAHDCLTASTALVFWANNSHTSDWHKDAWLSLPEIKTTLFHNYYSYLYNHYWLSGREMSSSSLTGKYIQDWYISLYRVKNHLRFID